MNRGAPIDDAYIRDGFVSGNFDLLRIEGIKETESEWMLGRIYVDKHRPVFRWGWGFGLSNTSHFRSQRFSLDDIGRSGVAAIFHQFDEAEHGKPMVEMFAGWVPADEGAALDGWIAFMNSEIQKRLSTRP